MEPTQHSSSIRKSPGTQEIASGHQGLRHRRERPQTKLWPQWPLALLLVPSVPALGSSSRDTSAAQMLSKAAEHRQVRGGGAPRSAVASGSQWQGSRWPAGKPGWARAPSPPVKVAEPARGLAARSRARESGARTRERSLGAGGAAARSAGV